MNCFESSIKRSKAILDHHLSFVIYHTYLEPPNNLYKQGGKVWKIFKYSTNLSFPF